MKSIITAASLVCLLVALSLSVAPASAATPAGVSADDAVALDAKAQSGNVTLLKNDKSNDVKPPKDKPKRSKKNPNDGKDGDSDDGDAGKGNDDKRKKNDGPDND